MEKYSRQLTKKTLFYFFLPCAICNTHPSYRAACLTLFTHKEQPYIKVLEGAFLFVGVCQNDTQVCNRRADSRTEYGYE